MNTAIRIASLLIMCLFLFSCHKNNDNEGEDTAEKKLVITGEFHDNNGTHSLCKTNDNNFVIIARRGESRQLYVARLNSSLAILWENSIGQDIDNAGGIIASTDGGLIIASNKQVSNNPVQINYGLNLLKLNHSGDILWEKNYRFESYNGQEYPIIQTTDGGFIIGVSYHIPEDPGRFYPTLFKVDSHGDSLWIKAIPDLFNCPVTDIGMTPDHGFLVSGPCALSRTDSLGNLIWSNTFGVHIRSLSALQDGSAVTLGNRYEENGWESVLLKVDTHGNTVWESLLMTGYYNESFNLCESAGSGFVVTEQNNYEVHLIKTDQNGKKISERNLDCYSSCGLVPSQGMYCCYTYRLNSSHLHFDLVVSLIN